METFALPYLAITRRQTAHERAMRAEIRRRRYTERHPLSPLCLGIPAFVYGQLRKANVRTIDELGRLTPEAVRDMGISTVAVGNLIDALDRHYS